MTRPRLDRIAVALVLMMIGLTTPATAAERMKHSGTIVSVAGDGSKLVLAEVGPWQTRNGATVFTYRTITLTSDTRFAIVGRAVGAGTGFLADFVELRIDREGLYVDDYITVDCIHVGKRLIALKITVTEALPPIDPQIGALR
jgi:hypothetical protein